MFGQVRLFHCSVEGHEAISQLGSSLGIDCENGVAKALVFTVEITIEKALEICARREKRTMALRSRLITDPREVLRIINNMSDDDNLSNEEDSASDDDTISPMLEQSDSESDGHDSDHDDPTPGPSGSGDTGSHVADPDSSSSDTDENVQARPKRSCIPTMASRGRARRRGAIPGPGRVRADRSRSSTRQPASGRGRGRTMARGRVPVRDRSTSRDRGWCDNFTPRQNTVEFTANVGPTFRRNRLPANVSPIHVFELFFDGPVIDLFVEQTNLNYERKKAAEPNKHRSSWQATSSREMKAFFGIAIAMGIVRLPKLHDYWRQKEWLFRMLSFAEVMPRDRFMQIYRYLHVSDDTQFVPRGHANHDPLFKVRALLDLMQTRFRTLYNPARELSIDESMIPFKGRIYFRQYIPSKRARFGIKAFVMAEAKSGYVCEIQIYTGARLNEDREVNLSGRVVRELMVHTRDVGHHLYTNNYYTKVPMMQELYQQKVIDFII